MRILGNAENFYAFFGPQHALRYFQANYAVVVSIIFLTMVIVKPLLLFLLVGIAAGAMTLSSMDAAAEVQHSSLTFNRNLLASFVVEKRMTSSSKFTKVLFCLGYRALKARPCKSEETF